MLGWLINSLGFGAIVPFMTVYFHTVRDLSMSTISLFFLAGAIARALPQSIGGSLSDKVGRKGLMMWSQFSRAVIYLLAGLAISNGAKVWVLAGIILSQYLLSSFFQPVASAMIADILPPKERSNGYALMRMAGNIGWGIGPAIGGFLFDVSYQSLFYFTSVTFLIAGFFILFAIKETIDTSARANAPKKESAGRGRQGLAAMVTSLKRDKIFLFFCVVALLLFLTWGQFVSTLSVFMKKGIGLSSTQIGWLYFFNAALVIAFQFFITQRTKHKNHFFLMMIGSLFFVLSYSLMGWVSSFGMMMIMIALITIGEMFAGPSGNTIASNMAKPGQYGRYQGIYSSISTLGWSLGPFFGGILMDLIPNMKIFWLVMSSFGLVAFFGFLYLYIKKGEHAE